MKHDIVLHLCECRHEDVQWDNNFVHLFHDQAEVLNVSPAIGFCARYWHWMLCAVQLERQSNLLVESVFAIECLRRMLPNVTSQSQFDIQ